VIAAAEAGAGDMLHTLCVRALQMPKSLASQTHSTHYEECMKKHRCRSRAMVAADPDSACKKFFILKFKNKQQNLGRLTAPAKGYPRMVKIV
jgi:hypothetical protein